MNAAVIFNQYKIKLRYFLFLPEGSKYRYRSIIWEACSHSALCLTDLTIWRFKHKAFTRKVCKGHLRINLAGKAGATRASPAWLQAVVTVCLFYRG